jgi:hypothetical protein
MNTSFLKLPLEAVGVASSSSPTMATDFLTLLWKLVDCNPKFTAKLLSTEKNVHQIMGVLVYSCLEYKDKPGTSINERHSVWISCIGNADL